MCRYCEASGLGKALYIRVNIFNLDLTCSADREAPDPAVSVVPAHSTKAKAIHFIYLTCNLLRSWQLQQDVGHSGWSKTISLVIPVIPGASGLVTEQMD